MTALPAPLRAADPTADASWWSRDETALAVSLLTTTGLAFLADASVRDEVQRSRRTSLDSFSETVNSLGSPPATLAVGGMLYAWGRLGDDAYRTETGTLAIQAVVAAEVATLALKYSIGRLRPGPQASADAFRPLGFDDGYDSLPSGHAAGAFALASILSSRSKAHWSPYLWYGLATLVGVSRVYQDDHWVSDVLVGALIGELSGRLVLRQATTSGPVVTLRPLTQGACAEIGFIW